MFSNSINSSLIGFARPNRVGEEEASWSTATSVGDVGGGRGGGREVGRGEYARFLSHGVDETPIRQTPICVPAGTTGVHDRSPAPEDQRAGIRVSSRSETTAKLQCCVRRFSVFDRSTGWDSFGIDSIPGRERLEPRILAIGSSLPGWFSLKEKQRVLFLGRICVSVKTGEQFRNSSRSQLG